MKKILVGIDGSQASMNALRFAVKMARFISGEIVGICVINEISYSEYYKDISSKLMREAEGILKEVSAGVEKEGVPITTRVEVGIPDVVFSEVAQSDKEVALIVVGASGRGRGSRVFIGSKSHALVNHVASGLPCPVIVVPGSSEEFLGRLNPLAEVGGH
jgi:nucleotide-binding universal stress UspA family protein